ncbi:MAG: CPBP family intramembrane metalloprotease [Bacteroidales bacterium]|nr:CPBP family intramembrane metalloprotease [Bacteroidales bacterium]
MTSNPFFRFLIRINPILFILFFLAVSYLINLITIFFPPSAAEVDLGFELNTLFEEVMVFIIIAPIVETLVFQSLIISGICMLIKRPRYNFYVSILLSAFAFSLIHSYNCYYMILTFLSGIILAFAYYIARYRKDRATLLVIIIHAIWNLLSVIVENCNNSIS